MNFHKKFFHISAKIYKHMLQCFSLIAKILAKLNKNTIPILHPSEKLNGRN